MRRRLLAFLCWGVPVVWSYCVSGVGHLAAAARSQRAAEDELFTGLDHNQREQLRQLLLSLQANLHPGQAPRCSPPAADHC
jgi:hypothetical protein